MSSGFGQLPKETLDTFGIPVAQMKTHSISVAEHAMMPAMMTLRRYPYTAANMAEGRWREDLDEFSYSELYHKTVGIVGLGNIGRWIAKICSKGYDKLIGREHFGMMEKRAVLVNVSRGEVPQGVITEVKRMPL